MIGLSLGIRFSVTGLDREGLETLFHAFGQQFASLEQSGLGVLDNSVAVDLGTGVFELGVTTEGETLEAADSTARSALLFALQSTGGTPTDEDALSELLQGAPDTLHVGEGREIFDTSDVEVTTRELVSL